MRRYIEQQNGGGEGVRAFIPVESGCPPVHQYIPSTRNLAEPHCSEILLRFHYISIIEYIIGHVIKFSAHKGQGTNLKVPPL